MRRPLPLNSLAFAACATATLTLSAALACAPVSAAGVDAGTLIENRAEATFETQTGSQTIQSNSVTLRVDEVLDAALVSLDPGAVAATAEDVVLSFELTNTGNGPEAFTFITNTSVGGNDFELTVNGIALDTNANGIYDDGVDQLLSPPETSGPIASDGASTVFVLASVPPSAGNGERSALDLQASSVTGSGTPGDTIANAGEGGSDAVVGANGGQAISRGEVVVGSQSVTLNKTAVIADPFGGVAAVPGATITYSIAASVEGTAAVDNLILTDAIPEGTIYVPGTLLLDNTSLSDASGDDAGEVTAAGVSVTLGTVPAGTTKTIQFAVRIEE